MLGSCVEELVLGHPVNLGLLHVEVLQEPRFGGLATDAKEVVDLLNCFEGFLQVSTCMCVCGVCVWWVWCVRRFVV